MCIVYEEHHFLFERHCLCRSKPTHVQEKEVGLLNCATSTHNKTTGRMIRTLPSRALFVLQCLKQQEDSQTLLRGRGTHMTRSSSFSVRMVRSSPCKLLVCSLSFHSIPNTLAKRGAMSTILERITCFLCKSKGHPSTQWSDWLHKEPIAFLRCPTLSKHADMWHFHAWYKTWEALESKSVQASTQSIQSRQR